MDKKLSIVLFWVFWFVSIVGTFIAIAFRAEVKPERILPEIEEQQEEPKLAVFVYLLLFVILSAISLILLFVRW